MAQFLSTAQRISSKIEDIIINAKEFVYLISPQFSQIQEPLLTRMWEALGRGVKVTVVYREATWHDDHGILLLQKRKISLYCNASLNTSAYLNETEGVVSSFKLFAPTEQHGIEFGVYFRKLYSKDMYDELLKESRTMHTDGIKMVVENAGLVSYEDVIARMPKPEVPDEAIILATKKLSVKEKQKVILKIFARECKECTMKIEGEDRLRIVGKGIVLALSNERVDVIFVHYTTFQARIEEVKKYILSSHPNLKAWFQYNRINMNLESEGEIANVFPTLRQAMTSFELIEQI